PQRHRRHRPAHPRRRRDRRCGGQAQHRHRRHGEGRRDRDRRGHEPQRRRQAVRRRRLRERVAGRRLDHAGARRRRPDDHHHAARQHDRVGGASRRPRLTSTTSEVLHMDATNPLLDAPPLPAFDRICPEHVEPASDVLMKNADEALEKAVGPDVPADYDALSAVLDVASERLKFAWGAVGHLKSVADTPELRAAYNAALPKVTELFTRHASDERLYAKYKAVATAPSAKSLSAPRRQALSNAMRDFVLSGAELQGSAKERFQQLQELQAELAQKFSEHVLDATDGFAYYASESELAGVPEDVKQAARAAAQGEGKEGHKLTLHFPSYFPVLQYAENRGLREKLYTAHVTR